VAVVVERGGEVTGVTPRAAVQPTQGAASQASNAPNLAMSRVELWVVDTVVLDGAVPASAADIALALENPKAGA
jgi:hypothetical protein